jgi:hypothetical protein
MEDYMIFKDKMGRWFTASLFKENYVREFDPIYTLCDTDRMHKGKLLPSFKRLYLELSDPTEWLPATTLLGGWPHWEALLEAPWFMEHLLKWRNELDLKLQSQAFKVINQSAHSETKESLTAAKYIVDKKYKASSTRGRPTKEEKAGHLKAQENTNRSLRADMERIGLSLLSSKK